MGQLLTPARVFAHHAFAAEYDARQFMILKGSLTAWLHVDVKEACHEGERHVADSIVEGTK